LLIFLLLLELECERSGSYTKVPDFFPHMKSPLSALNPNAIKILNKTWISVPQGSETNFKIKAKNAYEENLFKVIIFGKEKV